MKLWQWIIMAGGALINNLAFGQTDSLNQLSEPLQRLNYFRQSLSFFERTLEQNPETDFFASPYSALKIEDGATFFSYIRHCLNDSSKAYIEKMIEKSIQKITERGLEKDLVEPFVNYLETFKFDKNSNKDNDSILKYIKKAEEGYEKINFEQGLIDCYILRAHINFVKYQKDKKDGTLKETKEWTEKALELARKNNDSPGLISAYKLLWLIARDSNDPEEYFYYSLYFLESEKEKSGSLKLFENPPSE